MGEASFTAPKQIELRVNGGGTPGLKANLIFINTGARPSAPKGLENIPALNSTTIMELDSVPDHLMVIGGGHLWRGDGRIVRRCWRRAPGSMSRGAVTAAEATGTTP